MAARRLTGEISGLDSMHERLQGAKNMLNLVKNPLIAYRIAHSLKKANIPILPLFLTYFIRFFWGAYIPHSAIVGRGTKVGYGGLGVVIHNDAIIGENCLIAQNVTIGGSGTRNGVPRIGNNVHIGSGAKIIGAISIGDGSIVGANAVVVSDVQANEIVGGIPARRLGMNY